MQFTISREALLKPLQLVAGVVERRQTLPVLSNVLVSLHEGQLSLTGTDLEVELVGRVAVDDEVQPGDVTVIGIAFHSDDSPLNPANAAFGRIVAQLIGKQRSIKMIGVGQFAARSIIGCSNGEAA